jgi:hypothetical protein
MAIPPEPLEEVLPKAVWVVEGEVKEVLSTGPPVAPTGPVRPNMTSAPTQASAQRIRLAVRRVLRGDLAAKELVVQKPPAGYAVRTGTHGAFLLDGTRPEPIILGRYGPDTYPLGEVEDAVKQA